jgi:chloramphenicol O-acetyltransferase type A
MRTNIDLSTWNRAHLFRTYLNTDFPYINIGCEMDVTKLYQYTRENGLSFYFSMIYAATTIADEIENFRYRFEGEQPFVIDKNTAFATHLIPGEELFTMVECAPYATLDEFAAENRKKADIPQPKSGLAAMKGRLDIINFTCIPWVHYTHFVRTIHTDGVDCVPKISMGKFSKEQGKVRMPFSTQTHHGLTDGVHVGKYFQRLEEYLGDEGWK